MDVTLDWLIYLLILSYLVLMGLTRGAYTLA